MEVAKAAVSKKTDNVARIARRHKHTQTMAADKAACPPFDPEWHLVCHVRSGM